MPGEDKQTGSRWLWWVAGGATAVIAVAAAGAAWYYLAGQKVWTDGADIRRNEQLVRLRRVLWTPPVSAGDALNSPQEEYEPALSGDGEELYFVRGRAGRGADVYVSRRVDDAWSPPTPVAAINTDYDELGPRLSPDGRLLLFYSDRPGGQGLYDLWASRWAADGWSEPLNLGPAVNSPYNEYSPALTPDGRGLIFATNRQAAAEIARQRSGRRPDWRGTIRQGEAGDFDLFIAELATQPAPATAPTTAPTAPTTAPAGAAPLAFGQARELQGVNTPHREGACCVSPAGDFLYFTSNRPGGQGGFDLYRCRLAAGRCGDTENLGPELNTPASEMDPQLGHGGFLIYFSSDRPAGRGGYDLFAARSREVYALRAGRTPPRLSWSLWALIVAAAALIPLLLFLRAAGYKHLSLLQKCVVLSVLAHIAMTMLMSLFYIYKPILHHVAEAAGLTTSVNLEVAQEVEMRTQLRHQITDLPVTDLPVRDPTLAELSRPRPKAIAEAAPQPTELNVPRVELKPAPVTIQPEAPRLIRPAPSVEKVSLPPPNLRREAPTIRLTPEAPVTADEQRPEPTPPAPVVAERRPVRTAAPTAAPQEVTLAAVPARPQITSMAELPAAEQPAAPAAETVAPVPAPPVQARLDLPAPPVAARRVSARPATAPAVQAVQAVATRAETGSPRAEASLAPLAVPTVSGVSGSLAVAAAVSRPPAAAVTPVAIDIAAAADAPEIRLPVLASAGPSAEPAPVASSLRAPGELKAKPLASVTGKGAPESLTTATNITPAKLTASSLLRPEVAAIGRPRDDRPDTDRLAPAAPVTPLVPLTGPGRLASPDAFFQRSFEQRQKFIEAMGGSEESEQAVAKALAYLARSQRPDGHWPYDPARKGSGRRGKNDIAITGLASLCFLAGDHTPAKPGPYQQVTRKGVDYIMTRQKPDGDLRAGGDMYSHAIAALAVAEAAAMTGDPSYRVAAIKAGRFIVNVQNRRTGGWRYHPHDTGDTSVFGWQVMALHSIERAGMRIPKETRKLCFRWLDSVSRSRHRMLAGYQNPSPTLSMTAEAAASRIFLGQQLTSAQIDEVSKYLKVPKLTDPRGRRERVKVNYYYIYYGSLALMQIGNEKWRQWNAGVRDSLKDLQEPDGSWNERRSSKYGPRGGRVYATALSTLTLEVYYRYLPMYRDFAGPPK